MDLIFTDKNFNELGFFKNATLDLEMGKYSVSQNDFEITIPKTERDSKFDEGSLIYVEGSEYGGIVTGKKIDTSSSDITFKGMTWRGFLAKEYVQPPINQTHYQMRGEANQAINDMISNRFDDLVVVDELGSSGLNLSYDVRDLNLIDAIDRALQNVDARLEIKFIDHKLHLKAIPTRDLSNELQYDESYGLTMQVETPKNKYNHVLILGKGVGLDRTRLNYYLQDDGSWSDSINNTGLNRCTYKYSNAQGEEERGTEEENIQELIDSAIEKVKQENGSNTVNVTFTSDEAELFDIVASKEKETGVSFKDRITQKIWKCSIENYVMNSQIEYKVGDN